MPVRLTREERITRMVEKVRRRVDEVPEATKVLRHMPSSMLGVIVRAAGYERTSSKLLDDLSSRFRAAGVDFSPELTDPENTPKTRIYFFDARRPVKGLQPSRQLFKDEAQLSRFLWLNKDFLRFATKNLRITHREKRLAPGAQIDLLAIDTKTGELVGIELKAEEPDQGLVAQAARYMKALKEMAKAENRPGARLVIITGQPDEELSELVQLQSERLGVKTDWFLYRVRFELSDG
ncbi:Uncharacterised protein [Mycolicibacterium vanbaalenii]|uniref:Uncharacterized protein n=1 Tax=Mycolicibacterium vanbaalenii TaxID=110539 RepID=A0A5S9RC42_MYCVN|nr:hypothetical protein [Mycolicibacterium vanbaalenii]CAA0138230.1 Uncharacterised protein [Mycolicibacterium vanbaalenii]